MRCNLPAGTVTFLFTDMEGSTKLLHELGAEGYAQALAEHRGIVREACTREGGVEVDTQGDAFFFAFPTAPGALVAAKAITEALAAGPIRVRVGVHTGTPLLSDEGYVGTDVHRAARIAAAGHGGQVLVSASTASLARRELRDLGAHRLKDLAAPERVYQLGEGDFPSLKALYQTNLPVPANPLVGREKELVDVLRLLSDDGARVVTITGPGGIGKTRFAIAAAGEAAEEFPDGVWFVPLASLRDPELVLPTIGHAVAAEGDLVRHLESRACLLLLDNFEPVIDASERVSELVSALPSVRVLVTSREALKISAEREYDLPPLPESPAVEVFRQRASAVVADVEVDYGVAAEICARLDGLPLAIELAAARVKVFDPATLRERLVRRLPLLVSRSRDLSERQRTLHSTIAWSYELLAPEEQRLFRRLAVFSGDATLEAVAAITDAAAELVESLVDKSLLRRRGDRFVMLETIREFAFEQLAASDDADDVRRRHAEWFLALAEGMNLNAGKLEPGKEMRHDLAFAEHDNIRAALAWAVEGGGTALGLRLATAVEWFWVMHDPSEGMRWLEALYERGDDVPLDVWAHALRAYAASADIAGHDELATRLYADSLGAFEELRDDHGQAVLLHRLGIQAMRRGELDEAREHVEASRELHERKEDAAEKTWARAQIVGTLGAIARDAGEAARARELIAESAEVVRSMGIPWWGGVVWWHQGMLVELAALSLEAGRIEDAEKKARESLSIAREIHDYGGRVFGVGVLACVAAARRDVGRAGRLWGAIENDRVGAPLGGWIRHRASCEARITEVAGAQLDAALAVGRDLSLDQAVELALADA